MDGTVAKLCVARVSVVVTRERWGRKQEGKEGGREKNESAKEIDRERVDGNSTGRLRRRENTVTQGYDFEGQLVVEHDAIGTTREKSENKK